MVWFFNAESKFAKYFYYGCCYATQDYCIQSLRNVDAKLWTGWFVNSSVHKLIDTRHEYEYIYLTGISNLDFLFHGFGIASMRLLISIVWD